MLHLVRFRVAAPALPQPRLGGAPRPLLKLADPANPKVLTIGFARRFATYKRAALLFEDLQWLERIVCNDEHPVLFIFAGKAHPADRPGQELIRRHPPDHRHAQFEGRFLLVEDYDLRLARRLVSGVDVWAQQPGLPLEASGHLRHEGRHQRRAQPVGARRLVDEGYDGSNGWAIKPVSEAFDEGRRNREEGGQGRCIELTCGPGVALYYLPSATTWATPRTGSDGQALHRDLLPAFLHTAWSRVSGKFICASLAKAGATTRRISRPRRKVAGWKAHVRKNWTRCRCAVSIRTAQSGLWRGAAPRARRDP